jgi:cysteinyl-tRNA synthetase
MAKEQLKLYNTLTKAKEVFKPVHKTEVGIYTCGPTVYWFQHIGNMRAYIFSDTLKRALQYNSFKVKQIINITDVGHLTSDADEGEDKMEKAAKKEHKTAKQIAEFYFNEFHKDIKKLNILEPFKWTKATEHIKEQIALIKTLEKKGYTYKTSDGIYFDTSKFKNYGKLANLKIEKLKAGKRVDMKEKKNKTDFALWKFSSKDEKRQQEWHSPFGTGFPGCHVECSAMSIKYLGKHFDIHTGGEDHIPVHHTNEIAQSEAATGKKFVNYWLHVSFLTNQEGEKISKSKGGLYTLSELEEKGYSSADYRYFCLLAHYRKPLQFSFENLDAAKKSLSRIKNKILEIKKQSHRAENLTEQYENEFLKALNDDLNTPLAIQVLQKALDDFEFDPKAKLKFIEKTDKALGLNLSKTKEEKISIPKEIKDILNQRELAREAKDFTQADILRNIIKEKGYAIEDTPNGPKITKI